MKHIYKLIARIGMLMLLAGNFSCKKYLSEKPFKGNSEVIESVSQLEALLNNADLSVKEENFTAMYSTDDYSLPIAFYDAKPNRFSVKMLNYYTLATNGVANEPNDQLWNKLYGNIYNANLILYYVDKVRGDATIKNKLKAEAYFLRAYSNWTLASYYCLPYAAKNYAEAGLPKKISIDPEESSARMTLKETYDFIDGDIMNSLAIEQVSVQYTFRVSRSAINAFLSRYYLGKGAYDQALNAANDALITKGEKVHLVNYNNLGETDPVIYNGYPSIKYSELYNYSSYQYVNWPEFFYVRLVSGDGVPLLSQNLLNLYNTNYDMRYKSFVKPANPRFSIPAPAMYCYVMFNRVENLLPSGPTIQEVMLNKAECLLRKTAPDIQAALNVVNDLRKYRMDPADPNIDLVARERDQALRLILEERRRELPFAFRWNDLRRFSVNETDVDDVSFYRQFYGVNNGAVNKTEVLTHKLDVGSRRYAVPLNGAEILLSQGRLKQNTY